MSRAFTISISLDEKVSVSPALSVARAFLLYEVVFPISFPSGSFSVHFCPSTSRNPFRDQHKNEVRCLMSDVLWDNEKEKERKKERMRSNHRCKLCVSFWIACTTRPQSTPNPTKRRTIHPAVPLFPSLQVPVQGVVSWVEEDHPLMLRVEAF